MDAIEKNDQIILKGTNFESKPGFSSFRYYKFAELIEFLMVQYGKSIPASRVLKGKDYIFPETRIEGEGEPVPIPLQPYFQTSYHEMLLVVGSDDNDTLILTSPMAYNVRKYFGFSRWSKKDENYEDFLKTIEENAWFVPLTYNYSTGKIKKDWRKTVYLRKRNTVELYVVPEPLEYFPMLFINCSMDNARHLYDNITTLLISRNQPVRYSPDYFTSAISRPIMFNCFETHIEYKQRLPGIDVTEEEFVICRTEYLYKEERNTVSDCKCRSNTALIPLTKPIQITTWDKNEWYIDSQQGHYRTSLPPLYTSTHGTCNGCCDER